MAAPGETDAAPRVLNADPDVSYGEADLPVKPDTLDTYWQA
jgi:hypothetical protein